MEVTKFGYRLYPKFSQAQNFCIQCKLVTLGFSLQFRSCYYEIRCLIYSNRVKKPLNYEVLEVQIYHFNLTDLHEKI